VFRWRPSKIAAAADLSVALEFLLVGGGPFSDRRVMDELGLVFVLRLRFLNEWDRRHCRSLTREHFLARATLPESWRGHLTLALGLHHRCRHPCCGASNRCSRIMNRQRRLFHYSKPTRVESLTALSRLRTRPQPQAGRGRRVLLCQVTRRPRVQAAAAKGAQTQPSIFRPLTFSASSRETWRTVWPKLQLCPSGSRAI